MKMKYTSAFCFSFLLCASLWAQEVKPTVEKDSFAFDGNGGRAKYIAPKKDSVPIKTDRYGIRVGVDLSKLARSFYEDDYKGLEIVGDYRLTKKFWLAGEIGNENKTTDDDQLDFKTKGTYFKVGFDYNTYENWLDMENQLTVGLRYGVSSFSQELLSYEIYNPNPFFVEDPLVISGEKFTGLSASWLEAVAGVKVEVFSNLYVGFSLRLYRIVSNKKPDNFDNLYIPGYGRTFNGEFGAGFNYTVSYFVPIYKKKVKPAEENKKK
jgi:hypothetical protein